MLRILPVICCVALVSSSSGRAAQEAPFAATPMNKIAEGYVKLVLAMGQHDPDYVDAYYGPPEWKKEMDAAKTPLDTIGSRADSLRKDVSAVPAGGDELDRLRHQYLERQLSALRARVRMLKGERLSFDEESRALYDAVTVAK